MAKRKIAVTLVLVGLGSVLLYCSVDLQNLEQRRARVAAQQFDAAEYARHFWDERLPGVLDQSADAQSMLRLFNTDMAAAKQQGRTLGESRVRAYLLRGSGVIVSQDSRGVALSVTGPETRPEIMIRTGLFISGNAVRDASGLVDVSAFADTMKFNRVSSEINKIVVAEVIKPFLAQSPAVGQRVSFVGAAEVAEDATEDIAFGEKRQDSSVDDSYHLLQVVPIRLMVE